MECPKDCPKWARQNSIVIVQRLGGLGIIPDICLSRWIHWDVFYVLDAIPENKVQKVSRPSCTIR